MKHNRCQWILLAIGTLEEGCAFSHFLKHYLSSQALKISVEPHS